MISKKGFINVPFHWLFVILAGGFIMFLFAFFVSMGLEANNTKLSTELLLHFDTIFSTLATSELTETPIELSRGTELQFSCDLEIEPSGRAFVYSDFQLAGGNVDRNIEQFAIFTDEAVSGKQIITKTEAVDLPFTATSALFIVDTDTLYVGYYESSGNPAEDKDQYEKIEQIMNLLPANSSKRIVTNFNGEGYRSYTNIVIITLDGSQLSIRYDARPDLLIPEYFVSHNLRHINIIPDDSDNFLRSGEVTYYSLVPFGDSTQLQPSDSVTYHSPGLLLGTIISPSKEFYECTVWKIMDTHLRIMLELLSKKAEKLATDSNYALQCGFIYSTLASELIVYQNKIDPFRTIDDYASEISELESLNSRLEFESCPLIY